MAKAYSFLKTNYFGYLKLQDRVAAGLIPALPHGCCCPGGGSGGGVGGGGGGGGDTAAAATRHLDQMFLAPNPQNYRKSPDRTDCKCS